MSEARYETDLYRRLRRALDGVRIIDTHEHLQRESELPGEKAHIGRFFIHYAGCDLVSAGMPARDMAALQDGSNSLSPVELWKLIEPWCRRAWNTGYMESLRIALKDLYGFDDFSSGCVDELTDLMRQKLRPGFTRHVFDRAGIEFAMNHPFGPRQIFNPDFQFDCFIVDMVDGFTLFPIAQLAVEAGRQIVSLDDYLDVIEWYFDKYGAAAGAFKVGRAYDRPLAWEDAPRSAVEKTFQRLLAFNDRPDRRDIKALEDFILHFLCRLCGEYGIRMKFHTGIQEGNGNIITNSRAALMCDLFLKYPKTGFDIYHISYPYEEELAVLAKNFPNVTVNFCWMWVINPAAGRRALSDMLDAVPWAKIHGFGGDYIFVEGTYGHAVMARREIARVLCEKVEDGRFTEEQALEIGRGLLRDNALVNFGLEARRRAFRNFAGKSRE